MLYHKSSKPVLERIGKGYEVPPSCLLGKHELDDFGIYSPAPEDKEKVLAEILRSLKPGMHLLIGHPGYPSLENDALMHFETRSYFKTRCNALISG